MVVKKGHLLLCSKAGIEKRIGTHTFRRSREQHLLDAGYPILSVSKYLRHKRIETTLDCLDILVNDLLSDLEKIYDSLDLILQPSFLRKYWTT
ncbi:tyrosine-type recombinase/integrase [Methanolobus psychrotolerans]|uniref:tyrosine-type recombinase/integrase n=1 Tax=Methanolobus psychrotolerans TaxID=1874706 RepID=UPI000B91C845